MHQQHSKRACVCVCVCVCVKAAQSCLTLWDPMDYSLPDFSVHGILQARILEWVAIPFSQTLHGEEQSPALESSYERPKKTSMCLAKHHTMKMWARRFKGIALTQEALFCLSKTGPPVFSNSGKQTHILEGDQLKIPDSGEKLKPSTVPPHYLFQRFQQ